MSEPWDGTTERRQPFERRTSFLHGQEEILMRLDQMNESLSKVARFIEGNDNPERGAIVRLDRLEQAKASHDKRSAWMWGSIGGLGVKAAWDFLTKAR